MTCGKKSHQVDHLSRKYLKILGLVEQRPTADYLKQLIRAQQIHVPYENISKLLRRAENNFTIPDFVEFLNNLTEFNFGGTCYVQNGYFCHLLRHLGFQAQLVSATTAGRTSRDATQGSNTHEAPVSHTAIRVSFENDNYIVDLGLFSTFTGPFLLKPGHVVEAQTRNQRDRFEAIDQLSFKTQHFRNEELSRTHVSQPEPRELSFFSEPVKQSFSKTSTFMTTIATHRVFDSGAVLLWGRMGVIDTNGHIEHSEFANPSEMAAFYSKKLLLPRFPVRRAIEILRDLNGIEIFVSK